MRLLTILSVGCALTATMSATSARGALIFQDNFNRASLGGNWSVSSGGSSSIVSTALRDDLGVVYYNAATPGANYFTTDFDVVATGATNVVEMIFALNPSTGHRIDLEYGGNDLNLFAFDGTSVVAGYGNIHGVAGAIGAGNHIRVVADYDSQTVDMFVTGPSTHTYHLSAGPNAVSYWTDGNVGLVSFGSTFGAGQTIDNLVVAVPEPATIGCLAIIAIPIIRRQRKARRVVR